MQHELFIPSYLQFSISCYFHTQGVVDIDVYLTTNVPKKQNNEKSHSSHGCLSVNCIFHTSPSAGD